MESYYEVVNMPDSRFRLKSFISPGLEHMIEVHSHWHPEVEILYFTQGQARQQVNDNYFIAEPGDMVVIGKDQLHSTYSYNGTTCNVLVIMFDSLDFFELTADKGEQAMVQVFGNSMWVRNPIKPWNRSWGVLSDCVQEIHKEFSARNTSYQYIIKSLLYRMAGVLIRDGLFDVCLRDEKNIIEIRQMLNKTFELIDGSYSDRISLKKAASNSNLSVPHFCRLFKKASGMTFNDYLTFYRINRAEKMLGMQKTLTEIALECGFGSVSSFIRNFKKFKRCTPSSYKKL